MAYEDRIGLVSRPLYDSEDGDDLNSVSDNVRPVLFYDIVLQTGKKMKRA